MPVAEVRVNRYFDIRASIPGSVLATFDRRFRFSLASVVDDPGRPNSPGSIDAGCIIWERLVPRRWWRSSHAKASKPLAFSNASGRFSDPKLAFETLYLGSDPITCFWECGLGRNF